VEVLVCKFTAEMLVLGFELKSFILAVVVVLKLLDLGQTFSFAVFALLSSSDAKDQFTPLHCCLLFDRTAFNVVV